MSAPVRTIDGERPVREAAATIDSEGIGSLVVRADGERGLLTKTDLVGGLRRGVDPGGTAVADLMSTPLYTVAPDADVRRAVNLMDDRGVKHVVLDEGSEAVGIVTTTDVVDALAERSGPDAAVGIFAGLYDRDGPTTYECPLCGRRVETERNTATCPDCDRAMRDLSLSRE